MDTAIRLHLRSMTFLSTILKNSISKSIRKTVGKMLLFMRLTHPLRHWNILCYLCS